MPPLTWIRDRYLEPVKATLGGTAFNGSVPRGRDAYGEAIARTSPGPLCSGLTRAQRFQAVAFGIERLLGAEQQMFFPNTQDHVSYMTSSGCLQFRLA